MPAAQLPCAHHAAALGSHCPTWSLSQLQIVLSAAAAGGLQQEWCSLFSTLPMDRLQIRQSARALHTLNERLPLAPRYMESAVTLVQWLLLSSPHLPAELEAEMDAGDDATPADGAGSLWGELLAFFTGVLSDAATLSDETFARLLELLCQVRYIRYIRGPRGRSCCDPTPNLLCFL